MIAARTIIAWPAPNAQNTEASHGSALGEAEGRTRRNRFDRIRSVPGVPGTDRPWVAAGLLSPADRSPCHRSEVPRRAWSRATHSGGIRPAVPGAQKNRDGSHAWISVGPLLAGADTGSNEAGRSTVTLRTGDGVRTQMRPRHSSSSVMASAVPGRPSWSP
ncbi:hypothetical protein AB0K09_26590 [Streptomyces sp. NPDC049577]|uniref:hypothetical protein n=1 Tax=Streptomyces sp. NPDC049577 TaxID=3155153 RepID=UPI003427B84B